MFTAVKLLLARLTPKTDSLLAVVLVISVGFNFLLLYRPKLVAMSRRPPLWTVGTVAPPLMLEDSQGGWKLIDWESQKKPTVMYVFSPDCRWCDRNYESAKELLARSGNMYEVFTVALVARNRIPLQSPAEYGVPAYSITSPVRSAGYWLGGTPQTFLIGLEGRILGNWMGVFSGPVHEEMQRTLGFAFPAADLTH